MQQTVTIGPLLRSQIICISPSCPPQELWDHGHIITNNTMSAVKFSIWRGLAPRLAETPCDLSMLMHTSLLNCLPRVLWLTQFWLPLPNSCRSSLFLFSSSPAWSMTAPRLWAWTRPAPVLLWTSSDPLWVPRLCSWARFLLGRHLAHHLLGFSCSLAVLLIPTSPPFPTSLGCKSKHINQSLFTCWHPRTFHTKTFHFLSQETKWNQRHVYGVIPSYNLYYLKFRDFIRVRFVLLSLSEVLRQSFSRTNWITCYSDHHRQWKRTQCKTQFVSLQTVN